MRRYRELEDRELYVLAGKLDEAAFEELVTRYESFVYNIAFGVLKNADDAADAAQNAFLKLWRSASGWRGECEVKTWIYRIAKTSSLDAARLRASSASVPLDETIEVEDTSLTPEENVERAETARIVREAIAELPEAYREVIELRELGEMSYREIAEATGADIGTVKSRLSRARAELCAILKKKLLYDPDDGTNQRPPSSN